MEKVESAVPEFRDELEHLKNVNQQLEREITYYRSMFRHLYCVIFKYYKRGDGKFVFSFSDGILAQENRLRGSSLIGHTVEEMFPEPTASYLNGKYEQAYNGATVLYELEFLGCIYLTSLSPVIKDGRTIEVIGTAIDITDKKKLEGEMKTTRNKFMAIFEEAQDAILLFDNDGLPVEANTSASRLFGFSIEEIKSGCHIPLQDEGIRRQVPHSLERLVNHGSLKGETIITRKDGTYRNVEHVTKANILPGIHLTIFRDITDRKILEESLRKSETLQVVGELAAGIGHEIRNPMTALKGFIQLLKEEDIDNEYLDIILNEFGRIETIVSEFMVLAKPQAIHWSKEKLSVIVDSTLTLLNPLALLKNVEIKVELDSDLPEIMCEKNQLKQVFINLIKNGIESMESGKVLSVSIRRGELGMVVIQIADQGCGIPQTFLERIGEPFYTTKTKGTGLGLVISYRIIQNHNGTITVESDQSIGTTFTISLPVEQKRNTSHYSY